MTSKLPLTQEIKERIVNAFQTQDPTITVDVKRSSLGWIRLSITSSIFDNLEMVAREEKIDEVLASLNFNLSNYPIASYMLMTSQEAVNREPPQFVQMPLWSEILMAPEPNKRISIDDDATKRPLIVTFYSFKGGVGRSTALGMVANILATKEKRVVMIDFDLEAPGLSFMFSKEKVDAKQLGTLDYIHQRFLTPEENVPLIRDCIQRIDISSRGELYLIPAGEYTENYIHRLADLDFRMLYQRQTNPIHQLLDDVKSYLDPDIILIDARTGFTEIGAIALFDQADLGIICFSPSDQSFAGLEWVVKAAQKQQKYRGIPDLRFLITPMPPVSPSLREEWIRHASEWIENNWEIPPTLQVEEIYFPISYNPNITVISNLVSNNIDLGLQEPYMPIADTIIASLPEKNQGELADKRTPILKELGFKATEAQVMSLDSIPVIFQRTSDFRIFLQDRTWLVTGAKGTGKTLLFRLFVERPDDARKIAEPDSNLSGVEFVPGHGQSQIRNTLLNSASLASYEEQVGPTKWPQFWLNYMLLQLHKNISNLPPSINLDPSLIKLSASDAPQQRYIMEWLVTQAKSPQTFSQANDELNLIDRWLQENHRKVWIFYDELDVGYGQSLDLRRRVIEALLGWWVENGIALNSLTPKILLREDIWASVNFTNKSYYSAKYVQLRWEEDDLWRLVLRQALASPTFANLVKNQYGLILQTLNNADSEQLKRCLSLLWGKRMGKEHKAYTSNWIRNRISDNNNNRFPRSLVTLLQSAVEIEKGFEEGIQSGVVIRPKSLIEALPAVSKQRVEEVKNEYPEFAEYLMRLRDERSPITFERLKTIWEPDENRLKSLIDGVIESGVLQRYVRSRADELTFRYSVAELYLYGLEMTRQGQR